ncbi:MAG TPA: DUF4136 domain-containing protein [Terriglobia bacterium]|nr:DUF4136 domain-containing protein [Terriglobia bacterium]
MKYLLLAAIFWTAPASALAQPSPISCGQTLYIAPMQQGLDGYIRAQLVNNGFPLTVTTVEQKADLIMSGDSQTFKSHWYNSSTANKMTGNVTITDRSGKVVWAGSAGDRSLWWGNMAKHGPEKVAKRIVERLMKGAPKHCN